ncbi:MAG TPA: hypothetical protein VK891_06845 [Euzebyales bacterium]|nr:hypothetical protein [Euzebyales bacterium]
MLLMALFGAAVLALVCWVALREGGPVADAVIPQPDSEGQDGGPPGATTAAPPTSAGGSATGSARPGQPGELDDATVADADTQEALAAAAALWSVLTQDRG